MIGSVIKTFSILRLFTPEEPILTLTSIAKQLDYPKSSVHSMLQTLESLGFIEKVENNSYAVGKAFIPLTQTVLVNVQIRDRIAPLLRQLSDETEKSVYLTVPDHNMSLYIYAIETHHRLLARSAVGDRVPLHCTGVGKALMAFLPAKEQQRIIEEVGLPGFTETTITDPTSMTEELKQIFERGYSIDNQEHETGSFCVGAPIFDAKGNAVASCSVAGNDPNIIGEKREFYAGKITYTAQEASRRMGFVPRNQQMIRTEEGAS
jgi:DNA-binding IclR family transcriptional regulator